MHQKQSVLAAACVHIVLVGLKQRRVLCPNPIGLGCDQPSLALEWAGLSEEKYAIVASKRRDSTKHTPCRTLLLTSATRTASRLCILDKMGDHEPRRGPTVAEDNPPI